MSTTLRPALLKVFPEPSSRRLSERAEADYRLSPHYPVEGSLDDIIRQTEPGFDAFITEKYAGEIGAVLAEWSTGLRQDPLNMAPIVSRLSSQLTANPLQPAERTSLRASSNLEIWRLRFPPQPTLQREELAHELNSFFGHAWRILTASFELTSLSVKHESPLVLETRVRYDLVGSSSKAHREERAGYWDLEWERNGNFAVRKWWFVEEIHSRSSGRIFEDITAWALGANASYAQQLLRGTDYWRTVLDRACGIDVYGNNGVACGDIDNDGYDEIYVCQPAGLPNRLYRNRRDGSFEDVSEAAGVDVLDDTSCALFADVDNDRHQDLIVVRANGPLLFRNRGDGIFQPAPDRFRFAKAPQGTFTGAALADYDRDGWLDIYFCLYSYYEGVDQYRYPIPYHDAQNGPPNFLLHNNRDGTFSDVTSISGLNQNNSRFSFACEWCDYNDDGWPDLYVVNDFGRKNLFRNNRDGTFTDVAEDLGVVDIGPGMSCCWFDYDNDGNQDLYVCDMWQPAGMRVSTQKVFMEGAPENIRALYRRHAKGNSLFRNQKNGTFEDRSAPAEVEKGGWSWSCSAWDFDHDGYSDLYIANGMISGPSSRDLESFFWRQVVSKSPLVDKPSRSYEEGWNAINELIRSDGTWDGYQKNVFFGNNRDGTFSQIAGTVGLDLTDDSRAFALADLDHDGSLEMVLKNRTGPQLRIFRNVMAGRGNSICFRLRGRKSNVDAIGTSVTIESRRNVQRKFLQAGSGFLSQHSKELFFGLGEIRGTINATVRWPSGLVQKFHGLPVNCRVELEEGSAEFHAQPFAPRTRDRATLLLGPQGEPPPTRFATWLIDPLPAPDFTLPDLRGRNWALSALHGRYVLLNFWATWNAACREELKQFQGRYSGWLDHNVQLLAVNVNAPRETEPVRAFVSGAGVTFPILYASEEVQGIYNIIYLHLFDRRRNLGIPTSFLIDGEGFIVKVYQGTINAAQFSEDLARIPRNPHARTIAALPFPGKFYGRGFHRNLFSYGVAFFRAGYFDQSITCFKSIVREYPDYAAAHYNLGTLLFRKGLLSEARESLRKATTLRPEDASAWNNLGMVAAQEGRSAEAIKYFEEALRQNPNYVLALENLAKLYRDRRQFREAARSLKRAVGVEPRDAQVNYDLGMLFAEQGDDQQATEYLQNALKLRPDFPDALNNLGVLHLRTGNLADAEALFQNCIRVAPAFETAYLNLAKLYAAQAKREKARQVLRQLIEVRPGNEAALKALRQLGP